MTRIYRHAWPALLLTLGVGLGASVPAAAQSNSKQALAQTLAQIQVDSDGAAVEEQLIASAVQPLMAQWMQQVTQSVPEAQRDAVGTQIDNELKSYQARMQKLLQPQIAKAAKTAIAPIFAQKLSQEDLQTIVAFMQSPARAHLQALSEDASNAWFRAVVDATRAQVETDTRALDARAQKIISGAAANTSN